MKSLIAIVILLSTSLGMAADVTPALAECLGARSITSSRTETWYLVYSLAGTGEQFWVNGRQLIERAGRENYLRCINTTH